MSTIREQLTELFYDNNVHCDQTIEHLVDDVVDIINSSSDVVEVRHGEWDWYPDRMDRQELLCTNCEEPAPYNDDGEQIRTLYCPNCGAKMDRK